VFLGERETDFFFDGRGKNKGRDREGKREHRRREFKEGFRDR